MKRICLFIILVSALQTRCFAEVTNLPPDYRKVLSEVSRFHEIHAATNLPPMIFALCADHQGKLAEPGRNWQVTDVVINDKLPMRRLIWAFTDGGYYIVHYESGGIVHSYDVLVAKLNAGDSKPSLVWRGWGGPLKDYRAFVDALANDKLYNQ